ncbi:aspartate kinase [Desulfogranum mediterraneum]|uniref:aspartate kinase n=1 Tax=Desulfogranum mediterraneum TaxID=160661 RepID=UPI000428E171|nr:aspartate kinase [Desulfogranum mediterraneum]
MHNKEIEENTSFTNTSKRQKYHRKMKVIKIGGGCLKGIKTIRHISRLIPSYGKGHILVVSALYGVTDILINGIDKALKDEELILPHLEIILKLHLSVATHLMESAECVQGYKRELADTVKLLERYYYGLNFTGELTPKMADAISCLGERFSAQLLAWTLRSYGLNCGYMFPQEMPLYTDGKFGDATVDLEATGKALQDSLLPYLAAHDMVFVPGFYGVSQKGEITTFGRGGSDYSAAAIAAAADAEVLEIWKDVDGFMTADPKFVPQAEFIHCLSYEECAELSYFGATILHPRTVEPVRQRGIEIVIKNTMRPEARGTVITDSSGQSAKIIKSITYTEDIAILKVHASGVGYRPGILSIVSGAITDAALNIKSVVATQTCISFLLSKKDLDPAFAALERIQPRPYRLLEREDELVLLAIVGEGLSSSMGVAARCFSAISGEDINVEMISFGPSKAALYFLLHRDKLYQGVHALHQTFFAAAQQA